jgi:hypothetical protein
MSQPVCMRACELESHAYSLSFVSSALCQYILHYSWLKDSIAKGGFQDESSYLLRDSESESKFGFKLAARQPNAKFMAGWSIYVAPGVKPPPTAMQGIIQSAGGKVGANERRMWAATFMCWIGSPSSRFFVPPSCADVIEASDVVLLHDPHRLLI